MESYILDWFNLLLRFLHVITGIAWIGASFYFIWLDNSLQTPPEWKQKKGIYGDLWAIHGGGFYEVAKYRNAPEQLPVTLHWFKWEAYATWITGFILLSLIYYLGADTYLIDPEKADLKQWQAIAIGIAVLAAGWFIYDLACRSPLAEHGLLFGLIMLLIIALTAWGLSQLFTDRAVYIHIGALIGTAMAANVYFTIIPAQRELVRAMEAGDVPDPMWGIRAKLRSTHNNYATLPVIFIMTSNHYPMTYSHPYGWLVLVALVAIGAWARHFFNLRHKGITRPMILVSALAALAIVAWLIIPPRVISQGNVSFNQVQSIIQQRCSTCHSRKPTDKQFTTPPAGVTLDTSKEIQRWAPRILQRAVQTKDMPFMNRTGITEQERGKLGAWVQAGARTQ
ncbi:MAG TPA: hypothetical protein ENI62_10765 [Gammaproteobacteria bacterium]|nr:hypothetical protein [Gammaproteobacteria bacterium]